MITLRIRSVAWFVAGAMLAAAVAVLLATAWRADAAPGDDDATFVPITPCRLADTREPPLRVGPNGPFGPADTRTFAAVGTNGGCTIPADAVGLSLNVTALNASVLSFLTFWDEGALPLAASLNPAPGQPPVPNAVTTDLSTTGSFNVYNDVGTVDVVIDVNGYYTKSSLRLLDDSRAFTVAREAAGMELTATSQEVASLEVTAPVDGNVTVFSRTLAQHDGSAGGDVACGIEPDGTVTDWGAMDPHVQWFERSADANKASIAGSRTFAVSAGTTNRYALTCREIFAGGRVRHVDLTAIFTALP